MTMIRTYTELIKLPTFKERYEYLRLSGVVGKETFGIERYLNQKFYKTPEWKRIRDQVIIRDNGNDLGMDGYEIYGRIIIHHMNPIDASDIIKHSEEILDPDQLICVSFSTHNAIHYGENYALTKEPTVRKPNDTCPWRR